MSMQSIRGHAETFPMLDERYHHFSLVTNPTLLPIVLEVLRASSTRTMPSLRARWGFSRLRLGTVSDNDDVQRMRLPKQLSVGAPASNHRLRCSTVD